MGAKAERWAGLLAALLVLAAALRSPAASEAGSAPGKTAAKPPPPPPLDGTSYEYDYDAADIGRPSLAWSGRVFVHRKAAGALDEARPLLVFIHGLNTEKIKYRWMGGGQEGDVRRIVAELIEGGHVPPLLVAGPSAVDPIAVGNAMTSWPAFDLDTFLDRTTARLAGLSTIDRTRIIVAGHSGAGCNVRGGIATALKAKVEVLAGLAIDTCMGTDLARDLARLRPTLNVVVSWQTQGWNERPIDDFRATFLREVKKAPPATGVLRELSHEQPTQPMPHDAMVELTLKKWLPKLLRSPLKVKPPDAPPQ